MESNIPEVMFGIGDKHPQINLPYYGVSIEELKTPKNGYICLTNRWWLVSNGEALFYEGGYPQCSLEQKVAEYLSDPVKHPDLPNRVTIEFVSVAYVRPRY